MSIRKKILLYFSATVISLLGITLFFIYTLFYEFREEEFQQRQKQKITTTLKLLTEVKKADESIIQAMDRMSIHEFYDEKLLIFDEHKTLIYASIDDAQVEKAPYILSQLTQEHNWIETKEELYDVIGVYVKHENNSYYGISKAFDDSGYAKLDFLRYVLLFTFLGISLVVIWVSDYLSRKVTQPIAEVTEKIEKYTFDSQYIPLQVKHSTKEVAVLADQFNELMRKIKEATSFQKQAIHHISHELKTPIAVLVSNFERIEKEQDTEKIQAWIQRQKQDTKNLSEIINLLLEISKTDTASRIPKTPVRIDELIFDNTDELSLLHPNFTFHIKFDSAFEDDSMLSIAGSRRLLKAAFMNLMVNSIHYSSNQKAVIRFSISSKHLSLHFINKGPVLQKPEEKFLFQHFFRGQNSQGKSGFGLGLVFVEKIIRQHQGSVNYSSNGKDRNDFTIRLPLS